MPISVRIAQQDQGQIWTCHGSITGREVIEHTDDVLRSRNYDGMRWLLVDLSEAKLDASMDEIRLVGAREDVIARDLPNLITAVVVPGNYAFGVARMWEMLTERPGWSRLICRTRPEAERFLREQMQVRFGVKLPLELNAP